MKKILSTVFALSTVLVSCSKVSPETPSQPSELLPGIKYEKLTITTGSETKTALNSDHTSCVWSEGDKFVVYSPFEATYAANTFDSSGSEIGTFSGQVPEGTTSVKAVYNGECSCEGKVISVVIPSEQKAVAADSFNPAAHVAVAAGSRAPGSSELALEFATLNRLVKVCVPEGYTEVTSLSLTSAESDKALAGKFSLTEGMAMGAVSANASSSVTLVPASGSVIAPGTYYLSVAPVDITGFKLTYTFTDGSTYTKTSGNPLNMASSNKIRNLALSEIPMPSGVTVSRFTSSYDDYMGTNGAEKNLAAANTHNRFELVNGSVTATVPEGWAGVKYACELNGNANELTSTTITVSATGNYTLKGLVYAGGKTIESAPTTRVVTGLPYNKDNSSIDNFKEDWMISGNYKWDNSKLYIRQIASASTSFYIPQDIPQGKSLDVKVSYSLETYCSTRFSHERTILTVAGNEVINRYTNGTGKTDNDEGSTIQSFTNTKNSIVVSSSTNSGGGSSWSASHTRIVYIGAIYNDAK